MSTRRGTVYRIMNDTPKKECSICQTLIDSSTPETTLTTCKHKFHTSCINQWINSGHQMANTCPECRTLINPDQLPQQPQQQQFQYHHQQQPQILEHERRLQQVIDLERHRNTPVPFLGVVVCYNNQIIKRYLNTFFGLTTQNTLGELKARVLSDQDAIIANLPSDHVCTLINAMSTITQGFIEQRTRQIQITSTRFTTSSECRIDRLSYRDLNTVVGSDDLPLGNLYQDYQEIARQFRNNPYIKSVYDNYVERWDITGPEDPGYRITDYFLDPNGPRISEQFRARQRYEKSSPNSIAWVCFTIDCVRRGGKTRKNKKLKKTKKRNYQFLKRERTNNKRRKTRKTRI